MTDPIEVIKQASTQFQDLKNRTGNLANTNVDIYGADDARASFFLEFTQLTIWFLLQLDYFFEIYFNTNDKRIERYIEIAPEKKGKFGEYHDMINRTAYVTRAMFEVEHYLKLLSRGIQRPRDGNYSTITRELLQDVGLYTDQRDKTLNAPAKIRNALHNNGYHNRPLFEITLRGRDFKFEQGEHVDFVTWENLYIFMDELISVIMEITESPRVKLEAHIEHTSEVA